MMEDNSGCELADLAPDPQIQIGRVFCASKKHRFKTGTHDRRCRECRDTLKFVCYCGAELAYDCSRHKKKCLSYQRSLSKSGNIVIIPIEEKKKTCKKQRKRANGKKIKEHQNEECDNRIIYQQSSPEEFVEQNPEPTCLLLGISEE